MTILYLKHKPICKYQNFEFFLDKTFSARFLIDWQKQLIGTIDLKFQLVNFSFLFWHFLCFINEHWCSFKRVKISCNVSVNYLPAERKQSSMSSNFSIYLCSSHDSCIRYSFYIVYKSIIFGYIVYQQRAYSLYLPQQLFHLIPTVIIHSHRFEPDVWLYVYIEKNEFLLK